MSNEETATNGAPKVEVIPGTSTSEGFGSITSTAMAETASTAVAAQATAATNARYIMAMQRPRDWDNVRVNLLKECKRPRFAQVARYLKPVGKGLTGPSIRFAEAAIRCMGNIMPETRVTYDDTKKRIVCVSVTDLEANVTYSADIVIEKTVERSKPREGQAPIAVRMNSNGQKTFIVEAIEDDLVNKQGALVSKAIRELSLRLLPGDIKDEAMDMVTATQEKDDAADPDAARKRLVDAFVELGVKPSDLKTYLGHELGTASPAEIVELRSVYAAMRDGESNWKDALDSKAKASAAPDVKPVTVKDKVAAAKVKNSAPVPHTTDGEVIEAKGKKGDGADDAGAEAALGRQPGDD